MKFFNAQTRDQAESAAAKGQASRAKRSVENHILKAKRSDLESDQALKASGSVQDPFTSDQPESDSKTSRLVQFKPDVLVASSSQSNSHCKLAINRSSVNINNSIKKRIDSLLQQEILYKEILEKMESIGKNEIVWG